jgi:hypothetical protein
MSSFYEIIERVQDDILEMEEILMEARKFIENLEKSYDTGGN